SLSGERLHDQELALAFLDGVEAQRVVPSEVLEPLTQAIEAASGPRSSHIPSGSLRHATHVTRQLDTDFAVAIRAAQAAMPTREIMEAIQQASRAAQTAMPSREILEAIQQASSAAQTAIATREVLEAIQRAMPPREVLEAIQRAMPPREVLEAIQRTSEAAGGYPTTLARLPLLELLIASEERE